MDRLLEAIRSLPSAGRHHWKDHITGLERQQRLLDAYIEDVERAFVFTGAALRDQSELVSRLANHAQRLASSGTADPSTDSSLEAISLIRETLSEITRFQSRSQQLAEQLGQAHGTLHHLETEAEQLTAAVAPLRVIDVLFRIEAAGLPPEVQAGFVSVTHEIGGLDQRVRESLAKQCGEISRTNDELGRMNAAFVQRNERLTQSATAQTQASEQGIAQVERELTVLRETNGRIAAAAATVDRESSGLVVHLQYQDITRQKLEHVRSGIEELITRTEPGRPRASAAFVARAGRIESRQIAAAKVELENAASGIRQGVRALLGHLQTVEAEFLGAGDTSKCGDTIAAAIDILISAIEGVRSIVADAAASVAATAGAIGSCNRITSDLGATIHLLTWDIRLIALNAQVQAARVQDCDGLEVLARETYRTSDQTNALARSMGGELATFTGGLADINRAAEELNRNCATLTDQLGARSHDIITKLQAQRATVIESSREIGPLLRRTREHATGLLESASLIDIDSTPLNQTSEILEALAALAERTGGDANDADTAVLEAMERKYTMESERTVHAAVVGKPGARSSSATHLPAPTASNSNVELF